MSSKFLLGNNNQDILTLLNDGTQTLNVATITNQGLVPNLPVCANSMKELIGRQIGPSDLNFSVITNPLTSDLNANTHNITNVGNLSGATNTRTADSIVSNASSVTSGNVVQFNGTTGVLISDSGILASSLTGGPFLPLAGSTMTGSVNMGNNSITNIATLSGPTNARSADNIVSNAGTSVGSNITMFSGTTGKIITDSGFSITTLSGAPFLPLAGGTMSGAILMGGNNITGLNRVGGSTNSSQADNLVTNADGSAVIGNVATFGTTTGYNIHDVSIASNNLVQNTGGVVTSGDLVSFSSTTGRLVVDSNIIAANVITDSGSLVNNNLVSGSGSKTVQDSGIIAANVITDSGSLVSANLVSGSGSKTVQDSGIIAANVITDSGSLVNNNLVSGSGSKTVQDSGIVATNVVTNTGTSTTGDIPTFASGTGKVITDSVGLKRTSFQQNVYSMTTGAAGITNTTTQSTLLSAGVGSLTVPANTTANGTIIRIQAMAQFTILNGSQLNFFVVNTVGPFQFELSYNNSSGSTQTNSRAIHDISLYIKGDGTATIGWNINISTGTIITAGAATIYWDPTVANTLDFQAQWTVANATNLVFQNYFMITKIF